MTCNRSCRDLRYEGELPDICFSLSVYPSRHQEPKSHLVTHEGTETGKISRKDMYEQHNNNAMGKNGTRCRINQYRRLNPRGGFRDTYVTQV